MKFYSGKGLLILLISLFIFQSCKKEGDLGLEKQTNQEGLGGSFMDTSTISMYSVMDDSLISSNYVRNQLGEFHDPVFGVTRAGIAFQAILSKNNVDFGTNLSLDSVVLVMGYIGDRTQRFYGDSTSNMNIEVFQLNENISRDSVYYSDKNFALKPGSIGSGIYRPRPLDSLMIQAIVDNGPDSMVKVYPQMRIRLNDAFGQELLSKSGGVDLSENNSFLNAYKGFYVTATKQSGNGGVMSFDLTNSNRSFIILYYKNTTDTTNFVFNVNSVSARINTYSHDYTGTEVQQQLTDTTLGAEKIYIQSLSGLKAKLRFPHLQRLQDSGLVAINKAELIVKVYAGSEIPYAPIANFALKGRRADKSETLLSTALYNSSTKEYKVELTKSIQQIINGKLEFTELYLEDNNKQIRPNRTIISGPNSAQPIKLRVHYTRLY